MNSDKTNSHRSGIKIKITWNYFWKKFKIIFFLILLNFSLNFKFFLKSFLKLGAPEERLKLYFIPENAIKWPYTNSFDQDLSSQSEQADQDTPFLQTG